MDSSSDGSFAWTDASSDTIDSTVMLNDKVKKTLSDDESVSGKSYKKKLQKELFSKSNGDVVEDEEPPKSKERKRKRIELEASTEQASPKKKKIKMEPESDIDVSTRKNNTNEHNMSESYDESYLDLKVKAEEQFPSSSPSKIKKNKTKVSTNSDVSLEFTKTNAELFKHKIKSHSINESDIEDQKLNLLVQEEINQQEKKKKKKRKKSKNKEESEIEEDNTNSKLEDVINGTSGSPLLSSSETEELRVNSGKNKNPDASGDEERATRFQHDIPIVKSALNRRISERIQFEDDASSDMDTSTTSKRSSNLKSYLKKNVNLKPYTHQLITGSALTVDDDIWIVRCPKEVDINAFQNKDLVLEGKCKLKLNSQTYEGFMDDKTQILSILTSEQNNFVIQGLPVKGCLNLRKRIPKAHIQDKGLVGNQLNFIPLPETKCRHPLFGANYRKAVKLPTKVAERLRMPCPATPLASSKKKSRNDKKYPPSGHLLNTPKEEPTAEESMVLEMENDQSLSSKKKKKKRKRSESDEVTPKKKKQMKHDLESAEAWESEQAIEENLFNF